MHLRWTRLSLSPASPFRTAQATRTDKETLWVRLAAEGIEGWGEAAPMDTYGQTLESAERTLGEIEARLADEPLPTEALGRSLVERFDDQLATVAAVDAAMYDWRAKRQGLPVTMLLGLDARNIAATSFTIGIGEPDLIEAKTRAAAAYPILKVKVGTPRDEETLAIIRSVAPDKTIRVDANMAWTVDEALERIARLVAFDIEFVEQPIRADDLAGLKVLKEAGLCPIVADESCVRPDDVDRLVGCVDGVNIKLSKCGGITPALEMAKRAKAGELKIMLGCMIQSSLGIAAAAQLAPLADWLDLDGHLLLKADPFTGLGGAAGRLCIGQRPGLGVVPSSEA